MQCCVKRRQIVSASSIVVLAVRHQLEEDYH
jgi:hypothetical protein